MWHPPSRTRARPTSRRSVALQRMESGTPFTHPAKSVAIQDLTQSTRNLSREIVDRHVPPPALRPSLAMIAGGVVMITLWPFFTTLHGPTSVNESRHMLGMDSLFWGSMMEGPSSLLIALGLGGSYALLTRSSGRMARTGFVLTMIALVIPALVNLAVLAVMPPLLAPLLGIGLILMAVGNRDSPSLTKLSRLVLVGLAMTQLFAFLWTLAVRPDVLDRIDGYRIYGAVATVLFGVGWIVFGITVVARGRVVETADPPAAPAPAS